MRAVCRFVVVPAPIDRVIDVAVAAPVCAVTAVRQVVPLVGRASALGTVSVVRRLSEAVHELRGGATVADELAVSSVPASVDASARSGADTGEVEVHDVGDGAAPDEPTVPAVEAGDLAIEGYDDLAARQVVARLPTLDPDDLALIEAYERAHRSRSTVLGKIAQLTA